MAKIYGLFGAMTGKVADAVMVVRNGVQLVRKYQPIVSNPSSPAQVAVRARLKLMSQLAAVMGPYIAMRRDGIVSARNRFIKRNYGYSTFESARANIDLNSVQLTSSVVALPGLIVLRDDQTISAYLTPTPGLGTLSRVVYVVFAKEFDSELRYYASSVVSEPGANISYPTSFEATIRSVVVYAYGVRDNTEAARAVFGNMKAPTAQQVAQLAVTSQLTEADVTFTETRALTLEAGS